jgi:hypothetical protein
MKKNIFNNISVVQSLSDNDLHTGTKVKDDIDLYNFAYGRGLNIELFDANTKREFIDIIASLTQKALNEASFPLLHIEAHGSSDQQGIILKSNEFISWTDIKPHLINLNAATRLNLLVVFSLCHGAHFTSHLTPSDRAPCWGLVGPTKALKGSQLLGSFSAFYKEVFASGSGAAAVEKLNESSPKGDIDYHFTTATTFFINVYRNYLKDHCTERAYGDRAHAIRKKLKKSNLAKVPSIGELRRKLKSTQKDFFEKYKVKYFMIDLFPENENRFKVIYQDVMN